MAEVLGNYTTAQTATALIAAPNSNQVIRVLSVFIMSDTAGIVSLLDGTGGAVRFEAYPVAGGGVNKDAPFIPDIVTRIFDGLPGQALDVTTDITGNHAIHVVYEVTRG